jgi:two-component system, NtrC family, sensor kinase
MTFAISLSFAMILIMLVVTSYYRKERLSQVEIMADALLWQASSILSRTDRLFPVEELSSVLFQEIFPDHRLSLITICLLRRNGDLRDLKQNLSPNLTNQIEAAMIEATVEKQPNKRPIGNQWLFPGRMARMLFASQPLPEHTGYKAIGLLVDLKAVRGQVTKLNNLLLTYLLVNLVVFTLIGGYRLNRIYMGPIKRMVKRAEEFREEDAFFFAARSGDDEINHLSKSLNLLLSRISEDKRQLKQTVAELEVANVSLKRAQDEIVRAETLASVGRLAAGVAHEIGNPLGIVLGYLDLLADQTLSDEVRQDFLKRSESEIQRINSIIRQLLDLARPTDSQVDLVHLHPIVNDTVAIVGPQPLLKNIEIRMELTASHDSVLATKEQLRQVFLNLLLNAVDAIASADDNAGAKITDADGAGQIVIRSHLVTLNPDASPTEGEIIEICFEDNGPGIPPELRGHIFEPFFTTKEPGKGTGLGLSVSFLIIESLNGQLTAESLEEGGTRMRIRLPLYTGEASAMTA